MAISLEFEAGGWKFLFEAQEESYPTWSTQLSG
jgi:hypothetical protein